jgi:Na+/phosphate symporter
MAFASFRTLTTMFVALAAFMLISGLCSDALAQAASGIDFTRGTNLGNSVVDWIREYPMVWFFTLAVIYLAISAAMGRLDPSRIFFTLLAAFIGFGVVRLVETLQSYFA